MSEEGFEPPNARSGTECLWPSLAIRSWLLCLPYPHPFVRGTSLSTLSLTQRSVQAFTPYPTHLQGKSLGVPYYREPLLPDSFRSGMVIRPPPTQDKRLTPTRGFEPLCQCFRLLLSRQADDQIVQRRHACDRYAEAATWNCHRV